MKHLNTFKAFEGKAFKATKKPFENKPWDDDRKEAFRKKVEDHVKSQDCTTKQVGDDFEIKCGGDKIAQVMFRKDLVTVKKDGVKFGKEFKYEELGKIKSEITSVIKSCKK